MKTSRLKAAFSMSPSDNEELEPRSAASPALGSGAPGEATSIAVPALQPPENAASFAGEMRLVPTLAGAPHVGANATVTLPARPVTSSWATGVAAVGQVALPDGHYATVTLPARPVTSCLGTGSAAVGQVGTPVGHPYATMASPVFDAQNLHQRNDERRVISSQAPPLVSSTASESAGLLVAPLISGPCQVANESAGLLVAPLIREPFQEATSITAKKLVAGTSTTSAERTQKIGVTFRTDEPATYSQRERQHHPFRRRQKATTHSRTRNIYHPYDQRRIISSQRQLSYGNNPRQGLKTFKPAPSGFNTRDSPWTEARNFVAKSPPIKPRGDEQNGQYSRSYFQSSSYRSTLLSPPHPVRTPYGNDWASNEVRPHVFNQFSSVKTIEPPFSADVFCRRPLNSAHSTPSAACKNETSIYDYVKLLPLLPKIDSNDLCGSFENIILLGLQGPCPHQGKCAGTLLPRGRTISPLCEVRD